MFEVGRMCVKTAGREAGRYCVIVKKVDANFVLVTGPKSVTKVRRRKCNIEHLEPLMEKIGIKADASDEEVARVYKSEGILAKLERKIRAEPVKAVEKAEAKPAVKKEPAKEKPKAAEPKPAKKAEKKAETKKPAKKGAKKPAVKAKPAKKAKPKPKKK